MLLRLLLAVPSELDQPLRQAARSYPLASVATLGRVEPADLAQAVLQFLPDVVILDASADDGRTVRLWPMMQTNQTVLICLAQTVQYALDAFKANALHYLLSPFTTEDVFQALDRALPFVQASRSHAAAHEHTVHYAQAPFQCRIIALPGTSSIKVRTPEELVSAHGEGSYTRVMLKSEPPVLMSRSLGDLEPELTEVGLMRVHRSHMVNVGLIRSVRRGKMPTIQLADGTEVDVGERYKETLFNALGLHRRRREESS